MSNFNMNLVLLAGRMTADPIVKQTESGIAKTRFVIAVNRKVKSSEKQETDFFSIVAWRHNAEFVGRFFKKGSPICIRGFAQTNSWTDTEGTKRSSTDFVAEEISFVDSKSENPCAESERAYQPQENQDNFEELKEDDDLPF